MDPCKMSSRQENRNIVKMLLDKGAAPDIPAFTKAKAGERFERDAIKLACYYGKADILELIAGYREAAVSKTLKNV